MPSANIADTHNRLPVGMHVTNITSYSLFKSLYLCVGLRSSILITKYITATTINNKMTFTWYRYLFNFGSCSCGFKSFLNEIEV